MNALRVVTVACFCLVAVTACSSSFGGGSSPDKTTVVIPPGASVVCSDGTQPPCR